MDNIIKVEKIKSKLKHSGKELLQSDEKTRVVLIEFKETNKFGTFIVGADGKTLTYGFWFNDLEKAKESYNNRVKSRGGINSNLKDIMIMALNLAEEKIKEEVNKNGYDNYSIMDFYSTFANELEIDVEEVEKILKDELNWS